MIMRYLALYVSADGQRTRQYPQRTPEPVVRAIRTECGEVLTLAMVSHVPEYTEAEIAAAHARSDADAEAARLRDWGARHFGGLVA